MSDETGKPADWKWAVPSRDRLKADIYRTAIEGEVRGTDVAVISNLAAQVVASDSGGPAAIRVAALEPSDRWADARSGIFGLLWELGMPLPQFSQRTQRGGDQEAIKAWRHAVAVGFGWCDLPWHFEQCFLTDYPEWNHQTQMERVMIMLDEQGNHLGDPHDRQILRSAMRTVARALTDPPWGPS